MAEKDKTAAVGLLGAGVGASIAALLMAKPAEAAPPDEKINYLIECLTTLIAVLGEVAQGQTELIQKLDQWLAAQGIPPAEGVEVTVLTPWQARPSEELYRKEIRSAGTFYTDRMVDWTRGKRLCLWVNSSLDQAVQIQVIGNITNSTVGSTDINSPWPCTAGGKISIGLAWDDWHPHIGCEITVGTAPTRGNLTILAVIQE